MKTLNLHYTDRREYIMQYPIFPPEYKDQVDKEVNESINKENTYNHNTLNRLSSSKNVASATIGPCVGGGAILGLIVGVFVCFSCGDQINASINFAKSLGSALLFWFMFGIVGAVLGLIVGATLSQKTKNDNDYIDSQIHNETQRHSSSNDQIVRDGNERYKKYLEGFNEEAQSLSVQFAESSLAVSVIEWMTAGYCRTIDSADRRSHINQINIPFEFKVYKNKIVCNLGTFDFELERCEELRTPIEQTALARAIASAIQLNITMKYLKDISGTDIVTNINYTYTYECSVATITYIANNGNYQAVQKWSNS